MSLPLPPPAPWLLYQGPIAVTRDGEELEGEGVVWFSVAETPQIRFDAASDSGTLHALMTVLAPDAEDGVVEPRGDVGLTLVSTELDDSLVPRDASHLESSGRWRQAGRMKRCDWGDSSTLTSGRIHLINFGEGGPASRSLEVGDWTLQLRSLVTGDLLKHRCVATHVLDVARTDRSTFSRTDLRGLIDRLHDPLTFAVGRVVGMALPQGYEGLEPATLGWTTTIADPWMPAISWWDHRSRTDDDLAELVRCWEAASVDEFTTMLLRRAARCYACAQDANPLDAVIPVTAMGLELLTWETIQRRDPLTNSSEYERLSFASRLRLALRRAGIPTELPDECTHLRAYVAKAEIGDGPAALVEVRNRLVHPPRPKRSWPEPEVMVEAARLGLEYLALLTLSLIGYQGDYCPQFENSHYPGNEKPVPWSS